MKILVAAVLTVSAFGAAAQAPIDYRFDDVRRTVTLTSGAQEQKVARGQRAQGGDKVQTGWFSYALIASERYQAKFELFGSTDVRLAEGTPGVILSLERGRLHAIFDKITGSEPRIVKTPGALLAVRGTQYDVDVDKNGQTTLRVFEGIVELKSELRPEPIFIRAGEAANYGRREPPVARPMTQHER
ncbi:MAG TPA: FecR domain-containing protein, partial [Thermoanaerobaculia bacterium]|nr:FecR domain-containing protein [Thermoanaerobaculia bacterium]